MNIFANDSVSGGVDGNEIEIGEAFVAAGGESVERNSFESELLGRGDGGGSEVPVSVSNENGGAEVAAGVECLCEGGVDVGALHRELKGAGIGGRSTEGRLGDAVAVFIFKGFPKFGSEEAFDQLLTFNHGFGSRDGVRTWCILGRHGDRLIPDDGDFWLEVGLLHGAPFRPKEHG